MEGVRIPCLFSLSDLFVIYLEKLLCSWAQEMLQKDKESSQGPFAARVAGEGAFPKDLGLQDSQQPPQTSTPNSLHEVQGNTAEVHLLFNVLLSHHNWIL